MKFISVKNFENFQHYRTRNITSWIKLYFSILDDYDFSLLTHCERWMFVGLILLAGKLKNKIPLDIKFLSERLGADKDFRNSVDRLLQLRFIIAYVESVDSVEGLRQIRGEEIRGDKSREDKGKEKQKKDAVKIKHLDFIYLTKKESDKLIEQFGESGANKMIDGANSYAHQIGELKFSTRYKSHYHTMLNWERRSRQKKAPTMSEVPAQKYKNLEKQL